MGEWKGKTRGGVFGYTFFIGLIRHAGIRTAYAFLCFIVPYFIPFAPKATRTIWSYGRRVHRMNRLRTLRLLLANYYRLGQTLIDKIAVGNGLQAKYRFRFDNYDMFLKTLDKGNTGVVLIGAHMGNWEMGAPFFDKYEQKINIVMYDAEYQRIKDVVARNTRDHSYKIIPVNADGLQHVFYISEALNNKEYVCFQGDRFVNEDKLLNTELLGQRADFPAGPFLLASRLRVPVVFYFAMREPHRTYRFHFVQASPVKRTAGCKPEQALLHQYTAVLEQMLLKYPEQWFNYYPFWDIQKTHKKP